MSRNLSHHMYDPFAPIYSLPSGAGVPSSPLMSYHRSLSTSLVGSNSGNATVSGHCGETGAESQQLTLRSMFHSMTSRQSAMLEQFFKSQQGGMRPPRGPVLKSLSQSIGLSQAKIKVWYQWRQEQDEHKPALEHELHQLQHMAEESKLVPRTSNRYEQPMAMEPFESFPTARVPNEREAHNLRFQSIMEEVQHTLNEAMLVQADWFPYTDANVSDKGHVLDKTREKHGYRPPS